MSRTGNTTPRGIELPNTQGDHVEQPPERVVAEAIHNTRRRYALYYLHRRNGPVDLQDLVRQVAFWESCYLSEGVPAAQRRSVYSALHQTHLPYLEERGLVAFDRETNEIECLLRDSELDFSLAADLRTTVRWYRVHLLLAGVGTSILGGFWAGVLPFARVRPMVLATILVGTFAVASVCHWYDTYRWRRHVDGMPPDFIITGDRATTGRTSGIDAEENGT